MKKILTIFGIVILTFALLMFSLSKYHVEENNVIFSKNSSNDMDKHLYDEVVKDLGEDYFVENVTSNYVSEEYIEDLEYNSKANVYFGYTSEELDKEFQGEKYVFTYNEENNSTKVKKFEKYDDTYENALKNVAIGAGVIVTCVTVSSLTISTAPAISVILMTSAKTGAVSAFSDGAISAITAGVVEAIKTQDTSKAFKAAAKEGSEGFKWGAIAGSVVGGASKAKALKGSTLKGLTMNEAASIQKESKYPLEVVKNIASVKEYEYYKKSGLILSEVNGKKALVQPINLKTKSRSGDKILTNLERMKKGLAPVDKAGESYELHHIGQNVTSPLAILTKKEHHSGEANKIIHDPTIKNGVHKVLSKKEWNKQREDFWKSVAKMYEEGQLK